MKKRKLKGYVLPTLYISIMVILFVTITVLGTTLKAELQYDDLSVNALKKDAEPVISEPAEIDKAEENPVATITKPFTSEKVTVSKSYYDMKDDEVTQQNSLVYYENTYLQNSGILYTSSEAFDVNAVYEGTVTNVTTDEILGNVIEITHNTNLKTVYYSLGEINLKKDDHVNTGDIIGKSGDNNLTKEKDNCLLFEVYYNGSSLDPEEFYTMNINDLQ